MEWTNDLIFEFLNLYQREPALWNYMTQEHKNKHDAYEAWSRLRVKLKDGSIPIKEIKKKRDNLMSTYRRQRTKVKESMGNGADEIFKPEWPFYSVMASFLDDVYKPKKTKSSEDSLNTEDIEDEEVSVNDANDMSRAFKMPTNLYKKISKRSKLYESNEMKKRSNEAYNFFKHKTTFKRNKFHKSEVTKKRRVDPYNYLKEVSQKAASDTCSLYCDLLCNKLRALKEGTRDIAMMEIDKIMFNLKQQDNHTIGFQYQNTTPIVSQQSYYYDSITASSSPPPHSPSVLRCSRQSQEQQFSLSLPGLSHTSNMDSLNQQITLSLPSPGYSQSSNSQSSPQPQQFELSLMKEEIKIEDF